MSAQRWGRGAGRPSWQTSPGLTLPPGGAPGGSGAGGQQTSWPCPPSSPDRWLPPPPTPLQSDVGHFHQLRAPPFPCSRSRAGSQAAWASLPRVTLFWAPSGLHGLQLQPRWKVQTPVVGASSWSQFTSFSRVTLNALVSACQCALRTRPAALQASEGRNKVCLLSPKNLRPISARPQGELLSKEAPWQAGLMWGQIARFWASTAPGRRHTAYSERAEPAAEGAFRALLVPLPLRARLLSSPPL